MNLFLASFVLAKALDVHSTCLGLQQGAQELNPLLPGSCGGQVVMQSVLTTGGVFALSRLSRTHPKLAKGLTIALIAASGAAAAHNYTLQAQQLHTR